MNFSYVVTILNMTKKKIKMEKKGCFFDMDGVLVNFQSEIDKLNDDMKKEHEGRLDEVPGIFSLMVPMPGAIEACMN